MSGSIWTRKISKEEDKKFMSLLIKILEFCSLQTDLDMHKNFKNNPIQKGEVCVTLCVASAWWLLYEVSKVFKKLDSPPPPKRN